MLVFCCVVSSNSLYCTVGYACIFCGDQIFVELVSYP